MISLNQTRITEFILLGIEGSLSLKYSLFVLFSITYIATIAGNALIIFLIWGCEKLHTPMYFFLCHLSLSDIFVSTIVVPLLLSTLLNEARSMLVSACLAQHYFCSSFIISDCFLLTVMSYDRYLAICIPLNYTTLMDLKVRRHLAAWTWSLGFLLSLATSVPVCLFEYCGCNVIDHIYCDLAPLLEASCSDTNILEIEIIVFTIPVVLLPFIFVMVTYFRIFFTILKISTTSGRRKTFSTCSSHIIVVTIYYGTLIAKYTAPSSGSSLNVNKIITLLYTVFTPLLNPAVYSLRNQDIREAMQKWVYLKWIDPLG